MSALLDVCDLEVSYGQARALNGVSFSVPRNGLMAIVGSNGAGKTSLVRAIAGMLRPSSGRIVFDGTDITGRDSSETCELGIGQDIDQAAQMPGWMPLIRLMSAISLNLGIFNLLPIPILDGGMILFLLIETIMRRDVNQQIKERIYQVAFVCILAFFAFVIFNDLTRLNLFTKLKP